MCCVCLFLIYSFNMKSVLIFSVFIVLAQGSLFGEFQEAMSSLKSGFQKFVSDVVTDVKETIDCTIIAIETAFSIGSIVSSPLNSKCNSVVYENHDKYETLRDNDKKELLQRAHTEFTFDDKHKNNYLLNKFLRYLMVTNKKKVESVLSSRSNFENEHNLSNVVAFLKKEIEKISLNISEEVKIIESGQKSTEDYIVKYINLLHTLESKSKNDSELNEVRRILNGVSKIVSVNVSNEDDNDKFNKSLTGLEPKTINKFNDMQSTNAYNKNNKKNLDLNSVRQIFNNISEIIQLNLSNEESNDKVNKSLTSLDPKFDNNLKDTRSTVAISNTEKYSELNQVTQILNDASKNFQVNVNNKDANNEFKKSLPRLEPKPNNENYGTRSTIAQSKSTKNFGLNEGLQILDGSSKIVIVNVSNKDAKDKEVTVTTSEPKYYNEKKDIQSTTAKSVTSELSSNQSNLHLSTVTFKSIFTKALPPTKSSNVNMEKKDDQKFYSTEKSVTNDRNVDSLDYESIFGHKSDGGSHEEDLDEVRKMFEDSQSLNPILNDIFEKADQSDSNIFDNQF